MSQTNQKGEKLASAIYLITSFFDVQEPLRLRLRTLSTDLVSENVRDKIKIAREMISLFSIAKNAGLVSDANYEIIHRELTKFEESFGKPIDMAFFSEPVEYKNALPEAEKPAFEVKDKTPEAPKTNLLERSTERPELKDFGAVSVKKNSRQSIIINLLKRKKEIMIKDVSPLISGCSEKTIQRELLSMVAAGILKKVGEKRWSRYTLA